MSTRIVHRPARLHKTIKPQEPIKVAPVPTIRSTGTSRNIMAIVMPLIAGTGMVLMMFSSGNPIRMAIGCVMFVAVLQTAIGRFIRQKTGKRKMAEEERTRFLQHLEETAAEIRDIATRQRAEALARHPRPEALTSVIRDPYRLWERRRNDEDFLVTRIGTGTGELAAGIRIGGTTNPMNVAEPISQAHLDRMRKRVTTIEDLPIAIPARGVVSLVGPPQVTSNIVRSIIAQTAVFHAPDDVRLHLALPLAEEADSARWALWLPHLLNAEQFDGPIGRREVSFDEESTQSLRDELESRRQRLEERSKYNASPLDVPHLLIVADTSSEHGQRITSLLSAFPSLELARITLVATSLSQHMEPSHVDVRVLAELSGAFTVQLLDRGETPRKGKMAT